MLIDGFTFAYKYSTLSYFSSGNNCTKEQKPYEEVSGLAAASDISVVKGSSQDRYCEKLIIF